MIKSISIENFQSHKKTHIDFSPGVNAIVGLSDSGKTAIFRAFRWVFFNQPAGDGFRSEWGGTVRVEVVFSDNSSVVRELSKSESKYELRVEIGTDQESVEVFRAFGRDVPEPIQRHLNLNSTNMQDQMDGPFLLSERPGEAARILNKEVHLDIIDQAVTNIRRDKMEVAKQARINQDLLEDTEAQLSEFDFLDDAEAKIMAGEQLFTGITHEEAQKNTLHYVLQEMSQIRQDLSYFSRKIEAENRLQDGEKLLEEIEDVAACCARLIESLDEIRGIRLQAQKARNLQEAEEQIERAEYLHQQIQAVREEAASLGGLCRQVAYAQKNKNEDTKRYNETRRAARELEKQLPPTCPVCGNKIKKGAKNGEK